jgi:hypothetical protein
MVALTKQKTSHPLFAAVIRVAAQGYDEDRVGQNIRRLAGALAQFDRPGSNRLIPLENEGYPEEIHELDLVHRRSHRSGQFLNSEEIVSLAHLPSASVRSRKLHREIGRTKRAPQGTDTEDGLLGVNTHGREDVPVFLSPTQRMSHTYMIGISGTGKSALSANMILQDIGAGDGIAVLDPHGDLIDEILGRIPAERFEDVIVFDPSDADFPVGLNRLNAHSDLEKNLLASDLSGIFKRLSTSWGDQMNSVLGNAILAFLEHKEGGTLSHLRRFLVDRDYRKAFLRDVGDPEVVFYWEKEFPMFTGKPQGPILTRLDMFLRPKSIRNMVAQRENRIDFADVMNGRRIFLAKLAHGAIGEENSYLLGAFLVSKFHLAALIRQEIAQSERSHFYLYIDEFQNFTTPSMESLLSGGRQYAIGLVLAHQELRQLASRNTEVASSVIANPYTRICFRMGDADAKRLADGFSYFTAPDLLNLGTGEAICRVEQASNDFNLETFPLPEVDPEEAEHCRRHLIEQSRARYATPREAVEQVLDEEREKAFGKEIVSEEPPKPKPPKPARKRVRERSVEKPLEPVQKVPEPEPVVEPEPESPAAPEPTPRKTRREVPPPSIEPMGRGGAKHKYFQQLIKRVAEERGYRATIEDQIAGGGGSVDITLTNGNRRFACEISITTTPEQALGNVRKCFAAGFDPVILPASDNKKLQKLKSYVEPGLSEIELPKVRFFVAEESIGFLYEQGAASAGSETAVRGYKVKMRYKAVDPEEQKRKRGSLRSLRIR